jgi:hypothetical protein
MRVDGAGGRESPAAPAERSGRSFGEALERARPSGRRASGAPESAAPRGTRARGSPPRPLRGARVRAGADREGGGQACDALAGARAWPAAPAPSEPALASLVRALPPAIAAARARDGPAPLTLAFGRALEVDLRAHPSGIAIVLRPEARLEAAAAAELPRVVEALRARGVVVARAEVAGRGGGRRPR